MYKNPYNALQSNQILKLISKGQRGEDSLFCNKRTMIRRENSLGESISIEFRVMINLIGVIRTNQN
jgi:hypothetical protein